MALKQLLEPKLRKELKAQSKYQEIIEIEQQVDSPLPDGKQVSIKVSRKFGLANDMSANSDALDADFTGP